MGFGEVGFGEVGFGEVGIGEVGFGEVGGHHSFNRNNFFLEFDWTRYPIIYSTLSYTKIP